MYQTNGKFTFPIVEYQLGAKSPHILGSKIFNALPTNIKQCVLMKIFLGCNFDFDNYVIFFCYSTFRTMWVLLNSPVLWIFRRLWLLGTSFMMLVMTLEISHVAPMTAGITLVFDIPHVFVSMFLYFSSFSACFCVIW